MSDNPKGTPTWFDARKIYVETGLDIVAQMAEALRTLLASLEWEEKRSGTTYNGYEQARAALRAAGVEYGSGQDPTRYAEHIKNGAGWKDPIR